MMITQKEVVLGALQRGEELTTEIGLKRYSIRSLTQTVTELRRMGYEIKRSRAGRYSMAQEKRNWFGVEVSR